MRYLGLASATLLHSCLTKIRGLSCSLAWNGQFYLIFVFSPELVNTNSLREHADLTLTRSSGDDGDVAKKQEVDREVD